MSALLNLYPKGVRTVRIEGPLRMPASRSLRHDVHALLRRGERLIVLDLSGVSRIDAGGVGELIRTFNMTAAMSGYRERASSGGEDYVRALGSATADARLSCRPLVRDSAARGAADAARSPIEGSAVRRDG